MEEEGISYKEVIEKMKYWYNGYRFSIKEEYVYNPFTTLLLFDSRLFRNFWFETGTPTFLIKLIKEQAFDPKRIEDLTVEEETFSTYDIEDLNIIAILFQTGYLTIKDYLGDNIYRLYYPNKEVEISFTRVLLKDMSRVEHGITLPHIKDIVKYLREEEYERFIEKLNYFFANVPYQLYIEREAYYQTIFYLVFKLMGIDVKTEVMTSKGRIDAVVELKDRVYIFEFKLDGSAEEAMKQIKDKGYSEKYRGSGKDVYLTGVSFSMEDRKVKEYKIEKI